MASSDSSDDEPNLTLLREACDGNFPSESLYKKGTTAPPSLRPHRADDFSGGALEVTPGFRRYVAKRLEAIVDRRLDELLVDRIERRGKKRRKGGGVKLFRDSREFVELGESDEGVKSELRIRTVVAGKRRIAGDDELEEGVKVKLAAIDAGDVLEQKEVRNWAPFNRGKVFRYKKTDGVLMCID